MKLTDEQIAELAPKGCGFYCYKDGEIFFHNVLGLDVFNSKGESLGDNFLDSEEWKSGKPIPSKSFDISKYEFSDKRVSHDGDTLNVEYEQWCGHLSGFNLEELYLDVNKEDAIALAKHFKLTAEDLR